MEQKWIFGFEDHFAGVTPIACARKEKIDKLDFIKT